VRTNNKLELYGLLTLDIEIDIFSRLVNWTNETGESYDRSV